VRYSQTGEKQEHFLPFKSNRGFKQPASFPIAAAALALVFDSATRAQTVSPLRDDNQIWTEYQLAIPFNDKTDFEAIGFLRFGRNVSRPVNHVPAISTRWGASSSFDCDKATPL